MLKYGNRAKETSTTTGTGTLSLLGASDTKHRALDQAVPTGSTVSYIIVHQTAGEWEEGLGVVTSGSPDTLSRLKVESSSNSDALVNFSVGTKDVAIVLLAGQITELPDICNGRLTLESGVPVSNTDQTAKTTLYWTPYKGNVVTLHDGYRWKPYNFTELSIAVPATLFRIYDVYLYDNSGTLTLELVAWDSGGQTTGAITGATNATPIVLTATANGRSVGDLIGISGMAGNTNPIGKGWYISAQATNSITLEGSSGNGGYVGGGTWYLIPTARTTGLTLQDGIYVKSGDTTRRYLGTFMTTGTSGQTEDSKNRRLVWNNVNRVVRSMEAFDTTDTWTYATSAFRAANANTDIGVAQVQCVVGLREDAASAFNYFSGGQGVSAGGVSIGIGINRTAVNSARLNGMNASASAWLVGCCRWNGILPLGFSYIQRLELATASCTFWGDTGVTYVQTGLQAEVMT